eukprot:m.193689 g.193689  ORF g.193689 m.193689 type:complete len:78 (+) comp18639_c0_seq1:2274-2507(+)
MLSSPHTTRYRYAAHTWVQGTVVALICERMLQTAYQNWKVDIPEAVSLTDSDRKLHQQCDRPKLPCLFCVASWASPS